MMSGAAVLLLALGATAQVPDWVQKKSAGSQSNKWLANMQSKIMKSKLPQSAPNGRRLQAIMSDECQSACPGVPDLIKAMTEGRRLDGHEGGIDDMMKMCPHVDTLMCVAETSACQDEAMSEGDAEGMAMLGCFCACPKVADAFSAGDDGTALACKDKSGTVGCMMGESKCDPLTKDMDEVEFELECAAIDAGCKEKGEKMGECAGDAMNEWGQNECDEKAAENADKCCPAGKELVKCYTAECMKLDMAMGERSKDEGRKESLERTKAQRAACPDAGMPSDSEVAAAEASAKSGASGDSSGASTDFAARGQTVSMFVLAALMSVSMLA
jgi:hypothetical protein